MRNNTQTHKSARSLLSYGDVIERERTFKRARAIRLEFVEMIKSIGYKNNK